MANMGLEQAQLRLPRCIATSDVAIGNCDRDRIEKPIFSFPVQVYDD